MNFTELSDCELLVMKCLWDQKNPMTVGELIERMEKVYNKVYKETTVYTFLKRMKAKGYVTSYKKGGSYFSPLVSESDYLESYSQRMSEFLGEDASRTFLSAFFRHQKYTDADLAEIRSLCDDLD